MQAALLQVQAQGQDSILKPLGQGIDLQGLLNDISRDYIAKALKRSGDRKTSAAKLLGFTSHQTLSNWMKKLDIESSDTKD